MENRQGQELRAQVNTSVFYRIVNVVFAALFFGVVLVSIFNNQSSAHNFSWPLLLLSAAVGVGLVFAASRLFSLIPSPGKIAEIASVSGGMVLFAALCLIVGLSLAGTPAPDSEFGMVYSRASAYVLNGTLPDNYFLYYPTQQGFYALLCGVFSVFKLFGVTDFMTPMVILNTLAVCGAVLLMYFCARRLFGVKKALFILVAAVFTVPFLLSGPVTYTYTTTLPIPVAIMLLWMKTRSHWRAGDSKKAIITFLVLSGLAAIGALLKLTVLVVYIAVLIDLLVLLGGKGKLKLLAAGLGACVAVFLLGTLLINISPVLPEYDTEADGVPLNSWIMMGLSENGADNQADLDLILSYPDMEARKDFVSKEIANRFGDYMPFGIFGHFGDKLAYTFGDPTLGLAQQLGEGGAGLRGLFLPGGGGFVAMSYVAFGIQMAVLAWAAVAAAKSLYRKNDALTFARLAMLGLVVFLLLWKTEPGEIVLFVPVFLLCGLEASPAPMLALQKKRARQALQTNITPQDATMEVPGGSLDFLEEQPEGGDASQWPQQEPTMLLPVQETTSVIDLSEPVQQPMQPVSQEMPVLHENVSFLENAISETGLLPESDAFPVSETFPVGETFQEDEAFPEGEMFPESEVPSEESFQEEEAFPEEDTLPQEELPPEQEDLFPTEETEEEAAPDSEEGADLALAEEDASTEQADQELNWADQAIQDAFAQGYDVEYTTEDGQVFYQQPDGRTYYIAEDGQAYYYPQEGEEGYYAEDGQYYYTEGAEGEDYAQQVVVDAPDGQQAVYQDYYDGPAEPYWDEETQQWYVPQQPVEETEAAQMEWQPDGVAEAELPADEPAAEAALAYVEPLAEDGLPTEDLPQAEPATLWEEQTEWTEAQPQFFEDVMAEALPAELVETEEPAAELVEEPTPDTNAEPELAPELTLWPDIPELEAAEAQDTPEFVQDTAEELWEPAAKETPQEWLTEETPAALFGEPLPADDQPIYDVTDATPAEAAQVEPELAEEPAIAYYAEVPEEAAAAYAMEEEPVAEPAAFIMGDEPAVEVPAYVAEEPAAEMAELAVTEIEPTLWPAAEVQPELAPELTLWPDIPEIAEATQSAMSPPAEPFAAVVPSVPVEEIPMPLFIPVVDEAQPAETEPVELWPDEEPERVEEPPVLPAEPVQEEAIPAVAGFVAVADAYLAEGPGTALAEPLTPPTTEEVAELAVETVPVMEEETPELQPELTLWPDLGMTEQPMLEEPQTVEAWQQPIEPEFAPVLEPVLEAPVEAEPIPVFELFDEAVVQEAAPEPDSAPLEPVAAQPVEPIEGEFAFELLPATDLMEGEAPAPAYIAPEAAEEPAGLELFTEAEVSAEQLEPAESPATIDEDDVGAFAAPVMDIPEEEEDAPAAETWYAPVAEEALQPEEPVLPEPALMQAEELLPETEFVQPELTLLPETELVQPEPQPDAAEAFQLFPEAETETIPEPQQPEETLPEAEEEQPAETTVETPAEPAAREERKLPLWLEVELEEALLKHRETGQEVDVDKLLGNEQPEEESETTHPAAEGIGEEFLEEDTLEIAPTLYIPEEEVESVPDVLQMLDAELERVIAPEEEGEAPPPITWETELEEPAAETEPEKGAEDEEVEDRPTFSDEDVDDIIALLHIKKRREEEKRQQMAELAGESMPDELLVAEDPQPDEWTAQPEEEPAVAEFVEAEAFTQVEESQVSHFPEEPEVIEAFEQEEPEPAWLFEAMEAQTVELEPVAEPDFTPAESEPEQVESEEAMPEAEEPAAVQPQRQPDPQQEEMLMRALEFATGGLPVLSPAAQPQVTTAPPAASLTQTSPVQTSEDPAATPQVPAPAAQAVPVQPLKADEPLPPRPRPVVIQRVAPAPQYPAPQVDEVEAILQSLRQSAPPAHIAAVSPVQRQAVVRPATPPAQPPQQVARPAVPAGTQPQFQPVAGQPVQPVTQPQPISRPTAPAQPLAQSTGRPAQSMPRPMVPPVQQANTVESVLQSLQQTAPRPAVGPRPAAPVAPVQAPAQPAVQVQAQPPQMSGQSVDILPQTPIDPAQRMPASKDADWTALHQAINSGLPENRRYEVKKPSAYDELMKIVDHAKPEDKPGDR